MKRNSNSSAAAEVDRPGGGRRAILVAATIVLACGTPAVGGQAFSFGVNSRGRTGLGTTEGQTTVATPIVTSNLGGRSITQVSAGSQHSLLLTDDGSVFSFGFNGAGRTGLGTTEGNTTAATLIDTSNLGGRSITQVAAGGTQSLLLADDGSVFAFGLDHQGQAGLGPMDALFATVATPMDTSNLGGRSITQVAAGEYHSLLLADDGSVFSSGWDSRGRTGQGTAEGPSFTFVATPIDASHLGGRSIVQVAAGIDHSLLLADDGSVFSFGYNFNGLTGLGIADDSATTIATPIDTANLTGRSITQVAAGGGHSLLLADDGSVFSFGSNQWGQTGLGTTLDFTSVATPIDASNLGGRAITQVAAGGGYSLLMADDGSVFSFGSNGGGQTGMGTTEGNTTVATPIDTTSLGILPISDISGGNSHVLLVAGTQAFRWESPDGGFFSEGDHWATPGPPGPGDTAIFDLAGAYTVTLDEDVSVAATEVLAGNVLLELNHQAFQSGALVIGDGNTPAALTIQGSDDVVSVVAAAMSGTPPPAHSTSEPQFQTLNTASAPNTVHIPEITVSASGEFNLDEPLQAVVSDHVLIDGRGQVTNAAELQAGLMVIGDSEIAQYRVADEGSLLQADRIVLGDEQAFFGLTGGEGTLTVENLGHALVSGELLVGDGSEGRIEVRSGGTLDANSINMADNLMSFGSIVVTGFHSESQRSTLTAGAWEVGGFGKAQVLVSEGGVATVPENEGVKWTIHPDASFAMGTSGVAPGASSQIIMPDNSTLEMQVGDRPAIANLPIDETATMVVSENAIATVTAVVVGPFLPARPGLDELHADGHLKVLGLPSIGDSPGQLWIHQDLKVGRNGVVDVLDGGGIFIGPQERILHELLILGTDVSDKIIVLADGDLTFSGTINVRNEIEARPGAAVFRGGGQLNTGHSPGAGTLNSDLIMEQDSRWIVEIAGLAPGLEHDVLTVTGDATLDGAIVFHFLDGFAPQQGQQFEFLTFGGTADFSGATFEIENLLPGFEFDITASANGVMMTALNDGQFVPEPSTAALLAFAALLGVLCRPRRRRAGRTRSGGVPSGH